MVKLQLNPAIGNINTIIYTEKTRYVMNLTAEEYPILIMHGATGNGKSMNGNIKAITRIFNAPRHAQTFVLAGRDIQSLERRFVQSNNSPLNWYPFKGMWEYKKQGVGGARIIVKTPTGRKYIYLTPFNNVSTYSRILGETINGSLIDEAVEADPMFLQEMLARTNRTKGSWMIATSNGGDPNHFFYTHMVNRSMRIEEVLESPNIIPTPQEEANYYDTVDRKANYLTVHMALEDNPVYDKEQLRAFYDMYPAGSFMFNSRVLGVRGFTQDAPFSPYMTPNVFVQEEELRENNIYPEIISFTVDVGGHVFADQDMKVKQDMFGVWEGGYKKGDEGTAQGGHTVMLTLGWSNRYKNLVVLDTYYPNHMYDHINVDRIYKRVYNIGAKFPRARKQYMFCDPAQPSFFSLLRDRKQGVDTVRQAVKRDNNINLDEKVAIALIQQYMMNGRFHILDTPANRHYFYQSMIQANLESDGKLKDNKSWEADIQDSLKYQFTSQYRLLI